MSDNCLLAITNNIYLLINKEAFIQFLIPRYGVEKHHLLILTYLQSIIPNGNYKATFKFEPKVTWKVAQASKKIKYVNDLVAAETARIIVLRDQIK